MLSRRKLLVAGGAAAAGVALGAPVVLRHFGMELPNLLARPLPAKPALDEDEVHFVEAGDTAADYYAQAYNFRTTLTPRLRALCKSPGAVAAMVDWARTHDIPFALRSGGHSFEGLSQSSDLVIDTRLLNRIDFDRSAELVTVGAGALVTDIMTLLGNEGHAMPSGYCPSVGITGLTLGGGLGPLMRPVGLSCDVLREVEIVDAEGRLLTANAQSNPDLFWACRGGGGGSFGVVTALRFATHALPRVASIRVDWQLDPRDAAAFFAAWQQWLLTAPREIATLLFLSPKQGQVLLRMAGISVGSEDQLQSTVAQLSAEAKPVKAQNVESRTLVEAMNAIYPPTRALHGWYQFKSEVTSAPFSDDVLEAYFAELARAPKGVNAICEAMGGAADDIPADATAFPHRNAFLGLQSSAIYRSWRQWRKAKQSLATLAGTVRAAAVGTYVNYGEIGLEAWPRAYWGANLERLEAVKRRCDPQNVFRHAQSVPLA